MRARLVILIASLLLVNACSETNPPAAEPAPVGPEVGGNYVPQPVYCADGSADLCAVIPSFIGADPAIDVLGYQGLSNDVSSAADDAQTPFDNMSWQMFVALNWQASGGDPASGLSGAGPTVWQGYARPEDVFGGPTGVCPNPKDLPRFDIIAKSGGQGPRDEEFLQATGQPLIDAAGNWTLFERRLNDVERAYIQGHGLDTYAGQKTFVDAGGSVLFPPGDSTTTNGKVGAIEMKAAWRIVSEAEKDSYFHIHALIDVQGAYVRDGQPLCAEATLGLVGLHIIQANARQGKLDPKFIWSSFEHKENAPFAAKACDATDNNCYKTIANNLCPAAADAGDYSYSRNACSNVTTNAPPQMAKGDSAFIWERQPPYAGAYLSDSNGERCGTQVAHCWDVYSLTQQLNSAWQAKLKAVDSVFANYYLIGTNWGGDIEPEPGKLDNNSVPAFLANATLETYIQSDPVVGNCVGCHAFADLAYSETDPATDKKKSFSANFSFLPGLAQQQSCADVDAGPILDNEQAQQVCPHTCSAIEESWNGQWTTTQFGVMSVCGCCQATAP